MSHLLSAEDALAGLSQIPEPSHAVGIGGGESIIPREGQSFDFVLVFLEDQVGFPRPVEVPYAHLLVVATGGEPVTVGRGQSPGRGRSSRVSLERSEASPACPGPRALSWSLRRWRGGHGVRSQGLDRSLNALELRGSGPWLVEVPHQDGQDCLVGVRMRR